MSTNSDGHLAWGLFLATHALLFEAMDKRAAEAGVISTDWYDALLTLEKAPDHRLRLGELAKRVLVSRSGISRLTVRLVREGYVRREDCPNDRRGALAVLTPEGLAARERAWPVYKAAIEEHFIQHLSPEDAAQLVTIFSRLLRGIGREDILP